MNPQQTPPPPQPITTKTVAVGGSAVLASVMALAALIIKPWEGFEPQPYKDVIGVLTVCYGHTGGVQANKTYTQAECDDMLKSDMGVAFGHVKRCITSEMTVNQAAALTSAVFNLGPKVVCNSTLRKYANAGNWTAACRELTHAKNSKGQEYGWTYAGGQRYRGLIRRRAQERIVCEGGSP